MYFNGLSTLLSSQFTAGAQLNQGHLPINFQGKYLALKGNFREIGEQASKVQQRPLNQVSEATAHPCFERALENSWMVHGKRQQHAGWQGCLLILLVSKLQTLQQSIIGQVGQEAKATQGQVNGQLSTVQVSPTRGSQGSVNWNNIRLWAKCTLGQYLSGHQKVSSIQQDSPCPLIGS